jgi:hypothetical protein
MERGAGYYDGIGQFRGIDLGEYVGEYGVAGPTAGG